MENRTTAGPVAGAGAEGGVRPVKVGVIGVGKISDIYLQNCGRFPILELAACADLNMERAAAQAAAYNVPRVLSVDELLADPEIELVLNLTVPLAHAEVALAAVRAGKSVYNEKPLTVAREDGALLLKEARTRGVLVGCAPDTFLGSGLQTCRALIDEGAIGKPVAASASFLSRGPESWHPNPAFYYQYGGGPMFDMGPYYLTALVSILGPAQTAVGEATKFREERLITSQPFNGTVIKVEVPTHVTGILQFGNGIVGTITTSFDVAEPYGVHLTIYGTEGTLVLPDPNGFGGPVQMRRDGGELQDVPLRFPYAENSRGVGVADIAYAIRSGRPARANGELAFHVLDIMHTIHEAAAQGCRLPLESRCERPALMPADLPEFTLDQ